MADHPTRGDRVSIVIPCFNCRPFIEETITSAFHQTLAPHQVIAVDDGSTDGTWKELQRLKADHFPSLELLSHPHHANLGPSATRQRGVRAATGDHVAFLDGDDTFYPEKLETQVRALNAHPDVVLCHSAITVIGDRNRAESFEGYFRHNPRGPYSLRRHKEYLVNNYINTSSVMVRARVIKCINFAIPYRPHQYEDLLCWCLLAGKGRFLYLDLALTGYRVHSANTTSAIDANRLIRLHAILECRLALLTKTGWNPHCFRLAASVLNSLREMIQEYRKSGL
ncbi:glycosyltransferase [Synechococcus sp. CCY 9618]|uniref:glycosyltransferase family 2 protein n=1 Tax=Synechococcus sp. CCY 9618 TaxID=2815602 RepID=UPI001C229336|nr:glycosyltransferase [Synechococcus sp. CCY 9618]